MRSGRKTPIWRWVDGHRPRGRHVRHLFTTLPGGPVGTRYVRAMIARYAGRAGIERRVHPHLLRHTFATQLLREGFNIREVQRLMRHADLRTSAIYLEIYDEELERKIRGRSAVTSK
jgi:site-specific recombinase XerD